MPNLLGHKNTVETDQESSLVQAIYKYVGKTGDDSLLAEQVNGLTVRQRLAMALDYLLEHRYDEKHGLIWGATTSDWGDVQPEHSWGVELDASSHRAIDIYDNAMFVVAIENYLSLATSETSVRRKWKSVADKIKSNTRKHLWDRDLHKFRPHIYLEGSPFPDDFNEHRIYYHGGTAIAIEAGILSKPEILDVLNDMVNNKKFAGAASIGLTVYPPYPAGYFKNKSMRPFSYQNGGDWTWFGGRMIQQLIAYGYVEQAYQECLPMFERVRANDGFFEWYTVDNKPSGSGVFRGSAGVLGKAVQMFHEWAKAQ
jgi:glycogen debranching enzyme